MWDMFVRSNEPDAVNKIKLYEVYPKLGDTYGFVKRGQSGNFEILAMNIEMHIKNGYFDTKEVYATVIHEGSHITTLDKSNEFYFAKRGQNDCFGYVKMYGEYESCYETESTISKFVSQFYDKSNYTYYSKPGNNPSFVTAYARKNPEEDLAETYSFFKTTPKPTKNYLASQKILFFYNNDLKGNTGDMTHIKTQFARNISEEVQARSKDTDGDGLNDNIEKHRGLDPNDSDSDNDGIEDDEDVDADGDGHFDSLEGDSDNDGVENYKDEDDDNDGVKDNDDNDDNGDGYTDPVRDSDGDGTVNEEDSDDDNDGTQDNKDTDDSGAGYTDP